MVTRGTSQNERYQKYDFGDIIFLNDHERHAFEEITACFVFGDFKMPQTWTRAQRQCADPEGAVSLEPPGKQQVLYVSIEKCNLAPSPWKSR